MFSAMTLFSGPYALLARWVVLGIACLTLFGYGWVKGNGYGTDKLTKFMAGQATASAKITVKQGVATERVVTKYVNKVKIIKEKGDEITKLVPTHVTAQDDSACRINDGFLRLHNAAAANEVPKAASASDGAASGLKLSQTLEVVTRNYDTYHQVAARLSALQEWVRVQYEATNGEELK